MTRVFLGGEGANELGGWAMSPLPAPPQPGVLEALLRRLGLEFEVIGAVPWKNIRKFKAGGHRQAEDRNLLGLALLAREAGADVLAFVRDSDGDRSRERVLRAGLAELEARSDGPKVVGGLAIETLEAWILAVCRVSGSETLRPKQRAAELERQELGGKVTARYVAAIEAADLQRVPADAVELRRWLDRVRELA